MHGSKIGYRSWFADNVLVAVAYHIGHEKEFSGGTVYAFQVILTALVMLLSEIIARRKRRKVGHNSNSDPSQNFIISNFIPFTNLNVIFAISIFVTAFIKLIEKQQRGIPKLSIQCTIILLCLLITNKEAKTYSKKKLTNTLGLTSILTSSNGNQIEAHEMRTQPKKKTFEEKTTEEDDIV